MSKRKMVAGMAVVGFALIATSAPLSTTANETAVAPASVTLEQIVARMTPPDAETPAQPRREDFVNMMSDAMNVVMAQINRKDVPAPVAPVAAPVTPVAEEGEVAE